MQRGSLNKVEEIILNSLGRLVKKYTLKFTVEATITFAN